MMQPLTDEQFNTLTSFVKVNFGLDLTNKRTFVQLRVQKLIHDNQFGDFDTYFNHVCNDLTGHAVSNFISGLTVNYTLFFREPFHFEFLAHEVMPELYTRLQDTKDLRIWSAGCSTGEEPYTLAIIVSDFLGIHKAHWDMKILATDVSTFALKKALVGAYPASSVDDIDPAWVQKYFIRKPEDPDNVYIAPSIKDEIIFRKHNLVKDAFLFKQKFHVIFCRNVMIYFDEPTRKRLLHKFYDCLAEGGYLFVGMSESIDPHEFAFEYVMPSVYRKQKGS